MDLFNQDIASNILPYDGEVHYYGMILNHEKAAHYFDALFHTAAWKNDESIILGKLITTKRKVAWYADKSFKYTYSKVTKSALPWTEELLELKALVEKQTGEIFNSCLLNLYHSGDEGMSWHSDGEKDLKTYGAIASLSLGATRKFSFKHKKNKITTSVILENGSLLVMKGTTQKHWLHRLPPTKKVKTSRINLTFRIIENQ